MNKRLLVLFSLRIAFIEKSLKFLGLDDRLEQFSSDLEEGMKAPSKVSGIEDCLSNWENQLFDKPKMLELVDSEFVHPRLRGL